MRTHEDCKLDFSPIWNSQAPAGATVKMVAASQVGKVNVMVRHANGSRKELQFEVQPTPLCWRIADIRCASDGWSLLKLVEGAR